MNLILSHLQLTVDFKAKIDLFLTFMLIKCLVQMLLCEEVLICTYFADENMKNPPSNVG